LTVVDASVVADALVVAGRAGEAARRTLGGLDVLQAPQILVAEVVSAFRSMVRRGELEEARARSGLELLRSLDALTYPLDPFLGRIWELRDRVTVYDAWYIALAEHLETDLVTADRSLSRVGGLRCAVRLPD
jgi:predicted nucleic acid-binding protein